MISPETEHAASIIGVGVIVVLVLIGIDRALLLAEARGWINYRRNGLSRPGAIYHTFELHSVFDPAIQQVIEIRTEESKEQDSSGDTGGVDRQPPSYDPAGAERPPDTTS